MIDKRIVLIIGAGGSAPYGLPTGEKLKWTICDELNPADTKSESDSDKICLHDVLISEGFTNEDLMNLADRLRKSPWSSIDEFLEQHNDLQTVGKAAIAGILISSENPDLLSDPRDGNGNRIGNWYQQLFKAVFNPFEDIQHNNVTILTYNYDSSLETYLQTAMDSGYSRKPSEIDAALRHVPIVHLHGQLADHVYGNGIPDSGLRKYAQTIHIVTDAIDDNPEFQKAAQVLWEANEIYFIGFGYDEKNLKRLPIMSKYAPGSKGAQKGARRPSLNVFGTGFELGPARRSFAEKRFRKNGFKINLGQVDQDAFEYLRHTQLFGNR